jgi:dephospho-CoA kinase
LAENKHIRKASFESFHGPQLAAELKLLLGNRWLTVFVDADEATRQQRLLAQFPGTDPEDLLSEQALKDKIKEQASVQDNRAIADIVIDNNGSIDASVRHLLQKVSL